LDRVLLQVDIATGMSKGFAFLSYQDPKVSNLAIIAMSGQILGNKAM
jgi:RNA-binding protein 39